nr:N-acetylneuraminate synthase family protein [Mycoplasmatota bacterium]
MASNIFKRITQGKTFIIAELSANHGHDINIAKQTIKAAKESGANAVKMQTYTADTLTIDCDNEYFRLNNGTIWDGRTLYDLYSEAYTTWEWQKELKQYANDIGLVLFSTPFDKSSVDFLEEIEVPLYKVASFEIMDIPLIEYIASKGKPVIMSTGVASLSDIEQAVEVCKRMGNEEIILLKCTSSYPAKIEDANLNT